MLKCLDATPADPFPQRTPSLPSDATTAAASIQYSYEDPTAGYYLKTVTDALGRITTYKHGNLTTMNISEIDYPDGGIGGAARGSVLNGAKISGELD